MPVVGFLSAKGSPGVSTLAAMCAASEAGLGSPTLWVELDPSGGSGVVSGRASNLHVRPTLGDLARYVRESQLPSDLGSVCVDAPPGVPAVLAPLGGRAACRVIEEGGQNWATCLGSMAANAVVDYGRWDPGQSTADRIASADVLGLVCRSTLESVEHARHLVNEVRPRSRCPLAAIVVGKRPYRGDEVAEVLGVPLGGVVDWRRGDVAALWAKGSGKASVRSMLGRSAGAALASLVSLIPPRHALPPVREVGIG